MSLFGRFKSKSITLPPTPVVTVKPKSWHGSNALEAYEDLLKKGETVSPDLLAAIGAMLHDLDRNDEAAERFTEAAQAYLAQELWEQALIMTKRAERMKPTPTPELLTLELAISVGQEDWDDGARVLRDLSEKLTPSEGMAIDKVFAVIEGPTHVGVALDAAMADALIRWGRPHMAIEHLDKAIASAERNGRSDKVISTLTSKRDTIEKRPETNKPQAPVRRWALPNQSQSPKAASATDEAPTPPAVSEPTAAKATTPTTMAESTKPKPLTFITPATPAQPASDSSMGASPEAVKTASKLPTLAPLEDEGPAPTNGKATPAPIDGGLHLPALAPLTEERAAATASPAKWSSAPEANPGSTRTRGTSPLSPDDDSDAIPMPQMFRLPEILPPPAAAPKTSSKPTVPPVAPLAAPPEVLPVSQAAASPVTPPVAPSATPPVAPPVVNAAPEAAEAQQAADLPVMPPLELPALPPLTLPGELSGAQPSATKTEEASTPAVPRVKPTVDDKPAPPPSEIVDPTTLRPDTLKAASPGGRLRIVGDDGRDDGIEDDEAQVAHMLQQLRAALRDTLSVEDAENQYQMGTAMMQMRFWDAAVSHFQMAYRNPEYRLRSTDGLVRSLLGRGDPELAYRVLTETLDSAEGKALPDEMAMGLHYLRGVIASELEDPLEAIEALERVAMVDVGYLDTVTRLRDLYRRGRVQKD